MTNDTERVLGSMVNYIEKLSSAVFPLIADRRQQFTSGALGFQPPSWANTHNNSQGWEYQYSPNFNWTPPQQQYQFQPQDPVFMPPVQQQPVPTEPPQSSGPSMDDLLKQFMQSTQASLASMQKEIQELKLNNQQQGGCLPSTTINYPIHNVSAMTLMSGTEVAEKSALTSDLSKPETEVIIEKSSKVIPTPEPVVPREEQVIPPPSPRRYEKPKISSKQAILDYFRPRSVNSAPKTNIRMLNQVIPLPFSERSEKAKKKRDEKAILDAMNFPNNLQCVNLIEAIDPDPDDIRELNATDPLDCVLSRNIDQPRLEELVKGFKICEEIKETIFEIDASKSVVDIHIPKNNKPPATQNMLLPSVLQNPDLELKNFPDYLKDSFPGLEESLPVLHSSKLSKLNEEERVRIKKEYEEAIEWRIANTSVAVHCLLAGI